MGAPCPASPAPRPQTPQTPRGRQGCRGQASSDTASGSPPAHALHCVGIKNDIKQSRTIDTKNMHGQQHENKNIDNRWAVGHVFLQILQIL